ncbi:MAG: cation diffusion facilitator family transporter [Actinobacteria bacterium]|nr:cation diffusion facilitator family transporter [Actinomycetota bacterium]
MASEAHGHAHDHGHPHEEAPAQDRGGGAHDHGGSHGHTHGLVPASIKRSRAGLKAVLISLAVLAVTAAGQFVVYLASGSVALLADLIHNVGDALTAVPVGAAFLMRSFKAEKYAGYFVVAIIFISACVALYESVERLISPQQLDDLWALAAAGVFGFLGNEIAAWIRLRAGKRLQSPALVADGYHARTDGIVSLAVVASAIMVAIGLDVADPIIGLLVTLVILRITWQSFLTVRNDPGEPEDLDAGDEDGHGHSHDEGHAHDHRP